MAIHAHVTRQIRDQVRSLSNPNDRLRLLAEICCERYGDFERMLAMGMPLLPFD